MDITVKKDGRPVAGYAVKFVMRNYAQNSNNYFENMLGETANIRVEAIPYFQIFILFEKVPYYKKGGEFQRYDIISDCNLGKYIRLSQDNPDLYHHTPDKTLLVLLRLKEKELNYMFANADDYAEFYQSVIDDSDLLTYANQWKDSFDNTVICNDYENFVKRSYHIVMGKLK